MIAEGMMAPTKVGKGEGKREARKRKDSFKGMTGGEKEERKNDLQEYLGRGMRKRGGDSEKPRK